MFKVLRKLNQKLEHQSGMTSTFNIKLSYSKLKEAISKLHSDKVGQKKKMILKELYKVSYNTRLSNKNQIMNF